MKTEKNQRTRKIITSFVAPFVAILVFFPVFLGPLTVFRLVSGIPFDGPGPSWEIWILILSGGIGAGAARLSHDLILGNYGKFGQDEINAKWYSKIK